MRLNSKGRPMLSATAVNVGGQPGPGFYGLAHDIVQLTDQPEDKFWESEKKAVYETWKVQLKGTKP